MHVFLVEVLKGEPDLAVAAGELQHGENIGDLPDDMGE